MEPFFYTGDVMSEKKKRLQILEPCFVEGALCVVGEVIDVDTDDASHMVGNGRAKWAEKDAKVGKPKVEEDKK